LAMPETFHYKRAYYSEQSGVAVGSLSQRSVIRTAVPPLI
jgi:hypothetical protein